MYQVYYTNDFLRGFVSSLTIVGAIVLGIYYPMQSAISLAHSFMLGLLLYVHAPALFTSIAQRVVNGALCEFANRQQFECMAQCLVSPQQPTTLYDRVLNGIKNVNLSKLFPIITTAYTFYNMFIRHNQNLQNDQSFQEEPLSTGRPLHTQKRSPHQDTEPTVKSQRDSETNPPEIPQTTPTETPQTNPTDTAQPQTIPQTTETAQTNTEGVIPGINLNEMIKVMAENGPLMSDLATTAFKFANEFASTLEQPK